MVKTLESELIVMVDIDDTLIREKAKTTEEVAITIPHQRAGTIQRYPMNSNISFVRDLKARGYTVIVWSANGHKHATNVVKALNLEDSVDLIMTKPIKFIDDLPAEKVLVNRVFLDD